MHCDIEELPIYTHDMQSTNTFVKKSRITTCRYGHRGKSEIHPDWTWIHMGVRTIYVKITWNTAPISHSDFIRVHIRFSYTIQKKTSFAYMCDLRMFFLFPASSKMQYDDDDDVINYGGKFVICFIVHFVAFPRCIPASPGSHFRYRFLTQFYKIH
jgi:hypothetical protein